MHGLIIIDIYGHGAAAPHRSKASYPIDVPNSNQSCGHLLDFKAAQEILPKPAKPLNPHSQRLLVAQARTANPAAKPKAKAKGKAKAAAKRKASGGSEEKGDETSKRKSAKDGGNEPSPTRTEYSEAKKKWMSENLECTS